MNFLYTYLVYTFLCLLYTFMLCYLYVNLNFYSTFYVIDKGDFIR